MMKQLLLIGTIFMGFHLVQAQSADAQNDKIETARIGFLTERLSLSKEQAKEFWPVYEEYSAKRRDFKKSSKDIRAQQLEGKLPESEVLTGFKKLQHLKQKELDLDKEYLDKYLKVLKVQQVVQLYQAEHDFHKILVHKLMDSGK